MKSDQKEQIYKLLEKTCFYFDQSLVAYKKYLSEKQEFRFAKTLMNCNLAIRECLFEGESLFGKELQVEAEKLIYHYDIWIQKWNKLESIEKPNPSDPFIFQNEHRFPKESEEKIRTAFRQCKIALGK